jgi:hypothetical protein
MEVLKMEEQDIKKLLVDAIDQIDDDEVKSLTGTRNSENFFTIKMNDGSEFQIQIVQTKIAE